MNSALLIKKSIKGYYRKLPYLAITQVLLSSGLPAGIVAEEGLPATARDAISNLSRTIYVSPFCYIRKECDDLMFFPKPKNVVKPIFRIYAVFYYTFT